MDETTKSGNFFENGGGVSLEKTQTFSAAAAPAHAEGEISPKSRLATALLAYFLGTFGVNNFYLGFIGRGVVKIALSVLGWIAFIIGYIPFIVAMVENNGDVEGAFSSGSAVMSSLGGIAFGVVVLMIPGIWAFVEFIMALCGACRDKNGLPVRKW